MRIGGVEVTSCKEVLVLPRPNEKNNIPITAIAVDMTGFEDLYPKPEMPRRIVKGGVEDNPDSTSYISSMDSWKNRRFAYMAIQSLAPSNIEWETVDLDKPSTWLNWTKDLEKGGLSTVEVQRVMGCILTANSLNENRLEEARKSFVRGQEILEAQSTGQNSEPENTPSSQPVKDSE